LKWARGNDFERKVAPGSRGINDTLPKTLKPTFFKTIPPSPEHTKIIGTCEIYFFNTQSRLSLNYPQAMFKSARLLEERLTLLGELINVSKRVCPFCIKALQIDPMLWEISYS